MLKGRQFIQFLFSWKKFKKNKNMLYLTSRSFIVSSYRNCPIIPFYLADIGEGIAEVEILKWHVHKGDHIKQFDNVCEVQSDKATVEITSRYDGIIQEIHYKIGDMAKVGHPLIDIEINKDKLPIDNTKKNEKKLDILNQDKQNNIVDNPVVIDKTNQASHNSLTQNKNVEITINKTDNLSTNKQKKVATTPSIRRLAREHNINLEHISVENNDNRVFKKDILNIIKEKANKSEIKRDNNNKETISPPKYKEIDKVNYLVKDEIRPIIGIQAMMMKTMTQSLTIPHFGYTDQYKIDALIQIRENLKMSLLEKGIKLSYLPFFIKAISLSLKYFPTLNSTFDMDKKELKVLADHNMSIAMDSSTGLIVPNIKNVQKKNIIEIAIELNDLILKVKNKKIEPKDLVGGSFTVSNIGAIGGLVFQPVIMYPQVAIGAISKIHTDVTGSIEEKKVINISWSGDHRVVDGATMARFSNKVKHFIEYPAYMLTELK